MWISPAGIASARSANSRACRKAKSRAAWESSAASCTRSTFVGAETCKTCHPWAYAKWATTKHQKAVKDARRGKEFVEAPALDGFAAAHADIVTLGAFSAYFFMHGLGGGYIPSIAVALADQVQP